MNIDFTAEELAFQEEARQFLEEKYPKRIQNKVRKGLHLVKEETSVKKEGKRESGFSPSSSTPPSSSHKISAQVLHKRLGHISKERVKKFAKAHNLTLTDSQELEKKCKICRT